ncbi:MAG: ABC transporter ATP-binding protein [Microthrixaceae bacterium]
MSFSIDGREVVGLLGANGAGKTTAMRQALRILAPSEGTVTHFGVAPSRRTRARIGYVPQGLGLWADLSVRENLRFVERAYGSEGDREAALSDIDAGVPVGELSLGRQRRVAFAAAFGHRPELLILDEPTSGVDALSRSRLWDAIRTHAENGAGVLVSTTSWTRHASAIGCW